MKQNPDGKTVAATDLLVPGVGEIIGCSEREADYDKLLSAMKERNMDLDAYTDYLELRKFGSVPHSGFGLGFERILMYVTGISNIRDVILYPRTVGNVR
jgi:asparaginyl-tRNA synthetase